MDAKDVCRSRSAVLGAVACVDSRRNSPEARAAKGLNPIFTGCPACHRIAKGERSLEEALEEDRKWVADRETRRSGLESV